MPSMALGVVTTAFPKAMASRTLFCTRHMPEGFFNYFFPAAEVKKGALGVAADVVIPGWAVRGIVESYFHSVCLDSPS